MMYPNYYPYQQNISQGSQLIRVTGIEGAKAYQMSQNSTIALFDSSNDLMFIKSTDGAGFPTIRTFRFEEIEENTKPVVDYVSKAEFEEFKKEIKEYGKQFVQKSKQSTKQGADAE